MQYIGVRARPLGFIGVCARPGKTIAHVHPRLQCIGVREWLARGIVFRQLKYLCSFFGPLGCFEFGDPASSAGRGALVEGLVGGLDTLGILGPLAASRSGGVVGGGALSGCCVALRRSTGPELEAVEQCTASITSASQPISIASPSWLVYTILNAALSGCWKSSATCSWSREKLKPDGGSSIVRSRCSDPASWHMIVMVARSSS